MRYKQSTLKASTVHAYARHLLQQTLELEGYKPALPLGVVCSVLLLAACWQTSLTGACQLAKEAPSHARVRSTLYACLPPKPRDLLSRLLHALRQTLPEHLWGVPRVMALDLHQRPYYGKKNTRGTTRRNKKAGTRNSFTYATLAVLDRCGRFTVGLLPTRPQMRLTTIVEQLLTQAQEVGLRVSYLMLDKEFYAAEVIDYLQKRGLAFLMPAMKRASNQHLYEAQTQPGWYSYSWTARLRRLDQKTKKRHIRGELTVSVEACVARHYSEGKVKQVVYASWGLGRAWSPWQVAQAYRRRFGIEAKYRQLGQCLAGTTSRCERLRLLLVGLALLLGNLWSFLHDALFSSGPLGERHRRLHLLRLTTLRAALAATIAALFGGYVDHWPLQRPLPPELASFQT
jgi:putative transposase